MIKFSLFYFIISLFFGVLAVYLAQPKAHVVVKYPSIEELEKITYKDDDGVCYKYIKNEINC